MTWQPRIITTPPALARPEPSAPRRLYVRRIARVSWQQRGFILRTAVRLALALLAAKALPLHLALLVAGILFVVQVLCDEPAPSPSKPASLKSI